MAALTINKRDLLSRAIRSQLTNNNPREIDLDYSFAEQTEGTLGRILNLAGRLVGFVSNVLRGIQIAATSIYGWLVGAFTSLSQFDWNATDRELAETMRSRNYAIAAAWGSTTGTIVGQLAPIAIGAGIALLLPVVGGGALATAVIAASTPEALSEIFASVGASIRVTVNIAAQNALTQGYINFRRFIKGLPRDLLTSLVGENLANAIKDVWGTEAAPRLTLADSLEDSTDSIENPYLRIFTEEALEEFFDSFIESGFLVAQSLDQAIAEARAAQKQAEGKQRTVLIKPDKRTPGAAFALTGAEADIRSQIQTTINSYRTIASKDVGQIVGQPVEDWYKARPQRRKLTIVFKSVARPPYYRVDARMRTATYSIPEPKSNLTWERIKLAAKAYTWGKYRCTANLTNGRQMAVYGASPQEAETKLRDLLELSECDISTLSITEEKDRHPRLRKDATRMYPATGTMLVRRASLDLQGRTDLDGNTWDEEHIRFDLWCDEEPEEFQFVRFGAGDNPVEVNV